MTVRELVQHLLLNYNLDDKITIEATKQYIENLETERDNLAAKCEGLEKENQKLRREVEEYKYEKLHEAELERAYWGIYG